MTERRLSARRVATITEPGMHADGGGLYLRVTASGTRGWIYRYQVAGRRRDMGLGRFGDVSLAQARELAAGARRQVLEGLDPIEARAAVRVAEPRPVVPTFAEAATQCIAALDAGWRSRKHAAQWTATLATYAYPVIGGRPVDAVTVQDVMNILTPIWASKPETASRVRGRIEKVLDYARAMDWRDGENPARWRGRLDCLLPRRSRVCPVRHRPSVPYDQVPMLWQRLQVTNGLAAHVLMFQILTAVRPGEARCALWEDIHLDSGLWTIPGERMKSGAEHRVPLAGPALGLLRAVATLRVSGSPSAALVFPGQRIGRPLSDMAVTEVLRGLDVEAVPHGFRASFRTWAAEGARAPDDICEAALAHTQRDKTVAAYQRGDLFDRRRELMDDWAAFVTSAEPSGAGRPAKP